MTRRTRSAIAIAIVALLGSALLSSCGDDEERLSKADFTKQLSALCKTRDKKLEFLDEGNFFDMKEGEKAWTKAKTEIGEYVDKVNDLTPPEDADAMMDAYKAEADEVLSGLDDAIDSAKDRDQKGYSQAVGSLFETFSTIDQEVDEYGAKDCFDEEDQFPQSEKPDSDATVVDIGAKEYAFDIPSDIKAGKSAIKLSNKGNELHVFGFGRLKEGATFQQVKDAIERGEEDPGLLEDEGSTGLALPDGSTTTNTDLEAGTYVAYCFIPAPDGAPHLAKGMLVQFEVS
jgi:hypothetical protein